MSILAKCKTYLVGPLERSDDAVSWRTKVKKSLEKIEVISFDPTSHPYLLDIDEGKQDSLIEIRNTGNLNLLEEKMKQIRRFDLGMVDRADFIVAYIDPETQTWGSIDELVHAEGMNKPIFMCVEGGKRKCPLWLFSLVSHRYMYNSVDELLDKIEKIDSGEIEIDSKRWRLLKNEYR